MTFVNIRKLKFFIRYFKIYNRLFPAFLKQLSHYFFSYYRHFDAKMNKLSGELSSQTVCDLDCKAITDGMAMTSMTSSKRLCGCEGW